MIFEYLLQDIGASWNKVFDRLKGLDPEIRVLIASGYSLEGEVSQILGRGADGYIQKPFTLENLKNCFSTIFKKEG